MIYHTILIFLLLHLTQCVEAETLGSASYSDMAVVEERKLSTLWSPDTPPNLRPDFRPMELCDHASFTEMNQQLLQLVRSNHDLEKFEWTTISLTALNSSRRSYLLIGGSAKRDNPTSSPISVSPRDGGTVYLCELELKSSSDNPLGFGPSKTGCIQLSKEPNERGVHEYLGAASSTLALNGNTSILAYCDPLWRATTQVPVGRCFLQLLRDGRPTESLELSEFCQSGLQVATPCMAGHSIALSLGSEQTAVSNHASLLADIRLWVGQPLSIPFGRVQLVSDPFGMARITTIKRPDLYGSTIVGTHFGYALTDGYASAPNFPHVEADGITTVAQLVGIQTSDSSGQSLESFGSADWLGSIELDQIFTGFGTSVLKLPLNGSIQTAIIVGAPYADYLASDETMSPQKQTNRGRIYIFCHTDSRFRSPMQPDQFQLYNDSIDGPTESTFFGFALSRLGDLDGDGTEDIAVGAPDLDRRIGQGTVYLIRVLPSCRFDRSPLHILKGPEGAYDFGSRLPARSGDLDYNSWPDLAIPISTGLSGTPAIQLYATRPRIDAECRFTFPPWLAIRKIYAGDTIPIQITVYLRNRDVDRNVDDPIEQILQDEGASKLLHQVLADWNATTKDQQRFQLYGDVISHPGQHRDQLLIEFDLIAEKDVQDMIDIETENKGLYVAYRFLQPCHGQDYVVDENGTCAQSGWLKRPLINWSKCVARVPLTRYICYPRPACESDVSLSITDLKSNVVLSSLNESLSVDIAPTTDSDAEAKISPNGTEAAELRNPVLTTTVDLVFGDQASSRPELLIELRNHGPTFAAGLWLEFQFHGNLRFSRLVSYNDQTVLPAMVSENETWANFYVGTMPSPKSTDNLQSDVQTEEEALVLKRWKLSTYYPNYLLVDETNYTRGAGVTVHVVSGTPDPQVLGNTIRFDYRVVNAPKIRVSYGPKSVSSRMDNRTRPAPGVLAHLRRVDVSEVGPRVEHIIQVEYMGPTSKLKNVTFHVTVPFQLARADQVRGSENYLVYLFPEVRANLEGSSSLQWVDMWPKVTAYSSQTSGYIVGTCSIVDAENMVNPMRMVGMDVTKVYSRTRRHAIRKEEEGYSQASNNTQFSPEQLEIMGAGFEGTNGVSHMPSLFRRIPKEILQCDRVGYRLEKPICTQIICHLDELQKNRPVLFTVTGWLWAKTLFEKHISDVDVVTTLAVDQGYIPEGVVPATEPVGYFHLAQTFFFPQIRPKLLHQIPIWPIIVGVVLGIIFLALIVILLYVLGFFKRKKPVLRKASYSKGGADELERREQETTERPKRQICFLKDQSGGDTSNIDKYERDYKRKLKGKHRGDITILHPADLAASKSTEDEQHERLLTESEAKADGGNDNPDVTDAPKS